MVLRVCECASVREGALERALFEARICPRCRAHTPTLVALVCQARSEATGSRNWALMRTASSAVLWPSCIHFLVQTAACVQHATPVPIPVHVQVSSLQPPAGASCTLLGAASRDEVAATPRTRTAECAQIAMRCDLHDVSGASSCTIAIKKWATTTDLTLESPSAECERVA